MALNRFSIRRANCLNKMQDFGMDQLIVSSKYNLKYLLGTDLETGERMTVLLMSSDNKSKLFIHEMFFDQAPSSNEIEVVFYRDDMNPIQLLATSISKSRTLGIDLNWSSSYLLDILKIVPKSHIQKSTIVEQLREIKDEKEIETLRQSARIADAVMHQVVQLQYFPSTEREIAGTIRSFFAEHGINELSFKPIIGFGKNSANPHHTISDQISYPDEPILIDMGGLYNDYCSDITRTFFRGKVNSKYEDLYKIVKDLQMQAIEIIKPGVPFSEVDLLIRKGFAKWGYEHYFIHRTGHGIGLELHEGPFIHGNNHELIKEGMAFSIEPGLYLPDHYGIRIEDIVVVKNGGCEVLNLFSKEVQYLELLGI
ncbi:M24 family metallopeptidase [Fictibacillus terranigra]|uniref:Xaa-Pro peptidase family protein n=1 Tax=Fictibacillus terranigra TaxID=3058424 RepID=A0ABT8EBY6_9BACL|nr:Xaa-Pro peptidase family protein [Fictibacillus sp. CENA-BCM004]MDN4075364.1 Xaa-Pro peptidase family protein [Fictibacillus sp. CENA-BCM004]